MNKFLTHHTNWSPDLSPTFDTHSPVGKETHYMKAILKRTKNIDETILGIADK
jgi:hypothetical protein